jgi:hypothetical protein
VSPNEIPAPSSRRHRRRTAVGPVVGISARSLLIASESVPTTQVRAFRRAEPADVGPVSTITVNDARSSLVGWRSTVSLETVSGLDAAQLASTRLCVSPHPTTFVAGNPADVVRSSPCACAGPGDPNGTAGARLPWPSQ